MSRFLLTQLYSEAYSDLPFSGCEVSRRIAPFPLTLILRHAQTSFILHHCHAGT